MSNFDNLIESYENKKSGFNFKSETLLEAIEFLKNKAENFCSFKGKDYSGDDFKNFIEPLINLEKKSKETEKNSAWKVVVDIPKKNNKYISDAVVQFCSGAPNYDRLIITFGAKDISVKLDTSCVEKNPDLGKIKHKSQTFTRMLGSARVFPFTSKDQKQSDIEWGQKYTKQVEEQMNTFLNYMENKKVPFTLVNGGWAGNMEGSLGVPMMSHLFGTVHHHDSGEFFPPVTVMPKVGAFDRVETPNDNTYFEIDGVWGDDSKYLVGFSSALLVFEPYGYWTN